MHKEVGGIYKDHERKVNKQRKIRSMKLIKLRREIRKTGKKK